MKAGWIKTTVGATFTTATGGTPPKNNMALYGNFLPLVKPPELRDAEFDAAEDGLSEEGAGVARIAPPNSILVSCIGNLGKIGLNVVPVAFNQQINAILPDASKANPWFMFYQTLSCSFKDQLESLASGTTVPIVNKSKFNSIEIVLPPIPEQHRIVTILDEAFDGIATAKTTAEKNLQNARALFESHLQSVFTKRGEGWRDMSLGKVCSIARGGSPRPIQKFITTAADGINWIKIGDATAGGKYIYKTEEKIIPEGAKRSRTVHDGDFLLSNSMSFGRPYIMRTTGCIHDGWLVLSDYSSHLYQDYLYYVLGSQFVYSQFDRLAAGSTVRNLNIDLASRVEIPIPPLARQRDIANQFDAISEEVGRFASLYQQKLTALDELKKSLLHQAFSGNLTARHADRMLA